MVFNDLLESALLGCGTSRAVEEKSKGFRRWLHIEQWLRARYPASTQRGLLLRRSQMLSGALKNDMIFGGKSDERHTRLKRMFLSGSRLPDQQVEVRAWLRHLGDLLVTKAAETLSIEWREAAGDWHAMDGKTQINTLERLNRTLVGPPVTSTRLVEMRKSKPETILPVYYSTHTPSCMGKAQIVQGFARLAGAPSFLFVPVMEAEDESDPSLLQVCKEAYAFLSDPELPLQTDYSTLLSLLDAQNAAALRQECPSWMHGTIALPSGHTWLQVDPNMQEVVQCVMGFAYEHLAKSWPASTLAPGITRPDISSTHHHYPALLEKFRRTTAKARMFCQSAASEIHNADQLASLIAKLELGKELTGYCGIEDDSPRGILRAIAWLAGHDNAKAPALDEASLELLQPTGERLALVTRRIAHAICFGGFKSFRDHAQKNASHRRYPVMEVGNATYLLAVHTLGHLSVCYDVTSEFETFITHYCFSQWHLWYAACADYAGSSPEARRTAHVAAKLLQEVYPAMRLRSASQGIGEVLARPKQFHSLQRSREGAINGEEVSA